MKTNNNHILSAVPVSIIVPMRNSSTTVLYTLKSIIKQKYKVEKIIIVDNASTDNSIEKVKRFVGKSKIPIKIIRNKENGGVGTSYNTGVKSAKSSLVIFMHSDSSLPTNREIEKLTKPFYHDKKIVATYSYCILPQEVWNTYNFWLKRHLVAGISRGSPGMYGKFDCVKKDIFLKIGGFDEVTYSGKYGFGGEDADLHLKLEKEGKVVLSNAKVIHLHYLGGDYTLLDWLKTRKLLARTYGRLIRFKGGSLPLNIGWKGAPRLGAVIFAIKPTLAILPFVPGIYMFGIILLITYSLIVSIKMYTTSSTLFNPRIIFLPFIEIFLVYYETFWMIEAFFYEKKEV